MQYHAIAIDGPSGAGKSTIARFLAEALGFIYVDTGAMYRAIGLSVSQQSINPEDAEAVARHLSGVQLDMTYVDGVQRMLLDGRDVSEAIRTEAASRTASRIARLPAVRDFLLAYQRRFAAGNHIIMDGRDIGTVVLPDADVKIFLTADSRIRADRRYQEQLQKGEPVEWEGIHQAILQRDHSDVTRKTSPLRAAQDAITVDATHSSLDQVQAQIRQIIKEKIGV